MRGWPITYLTRAQKRRESQEAPRSERKDNPNGLVTVCDILRDTGQGLFELETARQLRLFLRPYLGRMSKRQVHDLRQLLQSHYGAGFLRAAGLLDGGVSLRLVTPDSAE